MKTPAPLLAALEQEFAGVKVPLGAQMKALRELFRLFTSERSRLPRSSYLDTPKYRLAYLRYHLPLNVARATCVLRDLLRLHPGVADLEESVDLGAGPGSASIATLLTLPPREGREYLLTDRSQAALKIARRIVERSAAAAGIPPPQVGCRAQKLPALPAFRGRALVWLSVVLNELAPRNEAGQDVLHLLRRLERSLKPGSVVILLESGLRAAGLQLLELHDQLLDASAWRILAPCTHQRKCPLLRLRKRPWCHFHLKWRPGVFVREVAAPLGLTSGKVSLSYLALERTLVGSETTVDLENLARVIGDPMSLRRGARGIYICHDGRRETSRLPEHGARRGDRVRRTDARRNVTRITVEGRWPG